MNTYRLYTKAVEIIKNVIVDVAIMDIITGKFNSKDLSQLFNLMDGVC
jgi:hypothetical protein